METLVSLEATPRPTAPQEYSLPRLTHMEIQPTSVSHARALGRSIGRMAGL